MTRYVWRDDGFYNRTTGERMETVERVCRPAMWSDVSYMSPLSLKPVTSRSQRREEMKIHNVREVDPSEYQPRYRSKARAIAMGGEWDPDAGKPPEVDSKHYRRMSRDELPRQLAKTVER